MKWKGKNVIIISLNVLQAVVDAVIVLFATFIETLWVYAKD